jgi:hypothetical protein
MQLVAYGAQDIYLTGNPQITFFKVVYRRHTNFAVESIEQTFNGSAALGKKFSCTIARNGDLLNRVYLETDVNVSIANAPGANIAKTSIGFKLLDYVELEIGGQCIDKHYGDWMTLWTDLTHDDNKLSMLNDLVSIPAITSAGDNTATTSTHKLYVPLQFWFCRNPGLALPLIALQYHEVKLNVQYKPSVTVTNATAISISNVCVFCDYVFLDTDERRRFAQVSHEYLIEQLQFSNALNAGTGSGTTAVTSTQAELRFNHPVKELVWTVSDTNDADVECADALLQLNGHDRFRRRSGTYFTQVQRYQHHTGSAGSLNAHIYSFALKPEDHQPSGTCNFSRIDNAVLNLNYAGAANAHTLRVYAVNYNVLRIMSGMGGLAYSN